MAPPSRTVDPELLLAQAGWVRSLVRRLVLDDALAEDVLQDTWVAALERPAPAEERGGLRAWLAAVARNLALRRRRREALRAAIEHAAARAEPVGGGQEELERMQLQRALADAVLALDEPYRSAVILRHLDGLSAAEIARRQGCTSELARQRVSRGLAQLRARLARQCGREANGCLALVPLFGRGWGGSVLPGGMVVGSKVTIGIAGAALAGLALWIVTAHYGGRTETKGAGGDVETASTPTDPPVGEALGALEVAADARGSASADEVPARPRRERASERNESAAPAVRGRVTDTRGRPLADAILRIVGGTQPLELTSGPDGSVAHELPAELQGAPRSVEASCEGHVRRALELDLALPFTIELQALPALAGRVLDPEGSPAAPPGYVKAEVLDAATRESRTSEAQIAADGSYRLEKLPLGRLVRVEARARGFAATELALDRVLEPDRTEELDLGLARGAVVTGTVLDRRTREPVPRAAVWLETHEPDEGSVHPSTRADEHGRFRLEGANEELRVQDGFRFVFFWLLAEAEGYVASPARGHGAQARDDHTYDFEVLLEPAGCSLRMRARLADGRPAGGATVWAIDSQGNGHFERANRDGVHVFEGLPAGPIGLWLTHQETLLQPGSQARIALELDGSVFRPKLEWLGGLHALRADFELAPGEARSEELVLLPPGKASLGGRVVDVEGRGVPDFAVRLQIQFQVNNLALASGWDETRTDADGRFRFEGLHPGKYQVWASGEGTALACASPQHVYVDLGEDEEAEVEELVVGPCFTIEGRIQASGFDLAALELAARDPGSGERCASTSPAADGSFRFAPLVAQDYEVVLLRDGEVLDRATVSPASATGLFLRVP